ncbi:hypothetical protein R4P65_30550 [Rhodococcus sp. IEGM 1318]|nr:hypothetical protein [Rhodococcus sp. IEGM 1318]
MCRTISPPKPTRRGPEKILWLRQQYHFGPQKISMYLARYHDVTISPSGVWRILHKLGLNRLPASWALQTHADPVERCEKQLPATNCKWT